MDTPAATFIAAVPFLAALLAFAVGVLRWRRVHDAIFLAGIGLGIGLVLALLVGLVLRALGGPGA